MSGKGTRPIEVLLIDDSSLARELVGAVLKRAGMRVTMAADGLLALEAIKKSRPDVVVLDLLLPRLDGIAFLRRMRARDPIPVVVCSNAVGDGTDAALLALEEGAATLVAKPKVTARGALAGSAAAELVCAVEEAAAAAFAGGRAAGASKSACGRAVAHAASAAAIAPVRRPRASVVAIGASTGGTEALRAVLAAMPIDAPPIVVVQHMPERFTAAFARRLATHCRIAVREATGGEALARGVALIAPGNRHLRVVRSATGLAVETFDAPPVSGHRPSVDVLFRSVAEAAGKSALGVIMTGMGNDGAAGLLAMKRAGAATIAQDRASSVVFGMPQAAIALGAAADVLPLHLIPLGILQRAEHAGRAAVT